MDSSPYAPPGAALIDAPEYDHSDAEAVRRAHVRHEIQVKAIGALYYFTGVMMIIGAFGMFAAMTSAPMNAAIDDAVTLLAVFYVVFGIAALFLGYGFRRLRSWVRIPGGLLSAFGLLAIPVGTIISAWILYLMFGAKGQVVLSPEYQDIIAAAPHVKYERTVGDWIATGLIIALLAGMGIMIVPAMR